MSKITVKRYGFPSKSTILIIIGLLCMIVGAVFWMKDLLWIYDIEAEACPDTSTCLERLHTIEGMLKVYWTVMCVGIIVAAIGFYLRSRPKPPVKKRRT